MDHDAVADALVAGAKSYIDGQLAAVLQRLAVLEARAIAEPVKAVGIESAVRTLTGELVFVLSDGRMLNIGTIAGPPGPPADPEELARAIAAEVTRVTPELLKAAVTDAVAAMPAPADGHTPSDDELAPMVARAVEAAVAALPPGPAGKDADPEVIAAMVERAVAAMPAPADGHTPSEDELAPLVARCVEAAVAGLPPPPAGKDADPAMMVRMIEAEVASAMAAMPRPADGKSVTIEELHPVIAQAVDVAVAARPPPKDGVGLCGALIDREQRLVLTLTDGSIKQLGVVVGQDADPAVTEAICLREVAKIPRPRDGIDGLGFDDLQVLYDGERTLTFRLSRGERVVDTVFSMPIPLDRGVWRAGSYAKGDGVTWDGSFFIAQCDTTEKPLLHTDWRQAVKAGRPGKHTESVKYLPATVKAEHAAP